jgi:hemerythrin-like domain-containing protein
VIPIGPLMREHRLIEHMLELMKSELEKMKQLNRVDSVFIETATDFIKTYADRCHHGKEEDVLFRDLAKKPLQEEHRTIMEDLLGEHVHGRNMVRKLTDAHERYLAGEEEALPKITAPLQELIEFYPRHIFKEDKEFFYPCMEYFSKQELDRMLDEFWDFDRKLIHEKYERTVKTLKDRLVTLP